MENINNQHCYSVYIHKNKINDKVYIGITSKINPEERWGYNGSKYNHNNHFKNAIKKYGWNNFEHIILFKHLTKEEAEKKEVELIFKYNATDQNYGYNIQNGGNSVGRMTDELKKKIGLSNSHPVYQYNKRTGDFLAEYISTVEAANILGLDHTLIAAVCRKDVKSTGGYIFRYKNDGYIYGEKLNISEVENSRNTHERQVVQYDKQGNFIAEYNSIKEAEDFFGKPQGTTLIWHCCNGKKPSALGYIWAYKGEPCIIKKSKKVKPVNQLDEYGNVVQRFNSVKDAAAFLQKPSNSIIKACKKDNYIYNGYLWEYAT